MVEFTYVITDEQGLHARPASQFVMAAAKCKSTVSVTFGSRTVNASYGSYESGSKKRSGDPDKSRR